MTQAVILAGGKGTRLRSRLGSVPKPLAQVGGTPVLVHQMNLLRAHGVSDVLILVNHQAEQIETYLRQLPQQGLRLRIFDDGEPRGTAGAVLQVVSELADKFIVLYGDTMMNVDLTRFWHSHKQRKASAASLFLHPNDHPQDSDLVETDSEGRIRKFHRYPHLPGAYLPNLVNAALYIVDRESLRPYVRTATPLDFAKDLFPMMLSNGAVLHGYVSPEYVKDFGTPERLDRVNRDWDRGVIARASLAVPQRAVFFDRDGTLNEDLGYISSPKDLRVFENTGPALRRLNEAEWKTVVITNQPVVARGEATFADLQEIHNRLETEMAKYHAYFDRIYFCPHHPDRGFEGEVPELKGPCACRKPEAGLIFQAAKELNVNLKESWMVGDSSADMQAAAAAGLCSILVQTGQAGKDGKYAFKADFVVRDFAEAVDCILAKAGRFGKTEPGLAS
jgi:D,D-heptose 1,7-bisphosphate phosphatase